MLRVAPLTLGALALGLDAYVIAGILGFVADDLHSSLAAIGQMVTAFTLAYALLSPVCATLLARFPMRAVLITALAVFSVGNLLTAVSHGVPLLMTGRIVAGLGAGLFMPVAAAAAAALVPAENRGRALALIMAGMSTAAALGVPIGLVIAQQWGWRTTLWVVTALGVAALVGVRTTLPQIAPPAVPSLGKRFAILADHRVAAIALITFFGSATSIGTYTYLASLLADTVGATNLAGYLWAWGLGGIVGSFAIGVVVDRVPQTRALVSGVLVVQGVALVLLPVGGHTPLGAVALLFVWGLAGWASIAPQQHRLLALRPDAGPVAVSLNSSFLYLGSAAGAATGGLMLRAGWSPTILATTFGIIVLAAAAGNLLTTRSVPSELVMADHR